MKDIYTKEWITTNSIEIVDDYEKGILTLRALHYQLVGRGMTNDVQHYKRVVCAMIDARWNNQIDFNTFSDLDRAMVGQTNFKETDLEEEIDIAGKQVLSWMTSYHKNRWENQPYYPEIFIEKKALQGVFKNICDDWDIALGACKGYPSLTFLHEASERFEIAKSYGKKPIIIYFGDYDPSGEDIPRSIKENIARFGVDLEVKRIALMEHQVIEWNLPPAPAKSTDSRTAKWNGLGQVELDAVRPEKLMELCESSIREIFDEDLYRDLLETENNERVVYTRELRKFVNKLKD
jgi:hypothetical protein